MKFYCRRCGNQIDLKRDRVEGKYVYNAEITAEINKMN